MNCKYYSYHEDASSTFSFPDPISQSEFRQEEARAQEKWKNVLEWMFLKQMTCQEHRILIHMYS